MAPQWEDNINSSVRNCLPSLTHNNSLLNRTLLCQALDTTEKSLFCSV